MVISLRLQSVSRPLGSRARQRDPDPDAARGIQRIFTEQWWYNVGIIMVING